MNHERAYLEGVAVGSVLALVAIAIVALSGALVRAATPFPLFWMAYSLATRPPYREEARR